MKPYRLNVILRPLETPKIGSLYLPEGIYDSHEATVVSIGSPDLSEDMTSEILEFKVGDHIIYRANCSKNILIGGEILKVVRQKNILGVIE